MRMYKDRFINYLKFEKRYSEHTIVAYEREIDALFQFLEVESMPFEEIDYRFLRYYFSNLKEQGKEATSVNRAISSLKSFYKFLMREGLVKQNPSALIKSLKTAKRLPIIVEKDKMVKLLDNMSLESEDFEQTRDLPGEQRESLPARRPEDDHASRAGSVAVGSARLDRRARGKPGKFQRIR